MNVEVIAAVGVKAILSCPHPLGTSGPSKPLTRVRDAMANAWGDEHVTFSPEDFPGQLVEVERLGEGLGPAFDDVVTERLAGWPLEHSRMGHNGLKVFLGGGGASLHQMELVREKTDAVCGTLWFSSHWAHAQRVLGEEYRKHGVTAAPVHPYVAWRAAKEQAASDFLIVPSHFCRDTYPTELRSKVHVAEFGVDAEKYKPAKVRDFSSGPLKVLLPATNPLRKGLGYALQAWAQLPRGKFHLTITGAPVELVNKPSNIDVRGWVSEEEMMRLMQDHHVLLLPSIEEGQALASLEGAASGMCLLLTPEVGLPIKDGVDGFALAARSADSIHSALEEAEADREGIADLGMAARELALKRPWERFEERVVEILKEESK